MYSVNVWYKFNLLGKKIVVLALFILLFGSAYAQSNSEMFNPRYDERKIITYGFSLAFQSAGFDTLNSRK